MDSQQHVDSNDFGGDGDWGDIDTEQWGDGQDDWEGDSVMQNEDDQIKEQVVPPPLSKASK